MGAGQPNRPTLHQAAQNRLGSDLAVVGVGAAENLVDKKKHGLAFGHQSEITTEAAGAVIMDTSLQRVDELFHIARRMRRIALQSAVGGMALSVVGMLIAFAGLLPPVSGAVFQEIIDVAAVVNALRAALPGGALSDYARPGQRG